MTSVLKLSQRDRRIIKHFLCFVLGCFLLLVAYIGIHVGIGLYESIMGSPNCVIAKDYSEIIYYGQTYVPLQTGEYSVRMGEELVSEAGVDGSSFLGKLLFGEKIYAVKGCGTDDLIYLQTDYDLVESDVYCRKDRKAYYEELLQMLQPKTYYLETIQSDWTNGIVPADEKLVSCVFGNVDELTPNTTVDRGFSRGEGDEMVLVYAYDADGIFAHSVGTLYCQKNQYFWEYQDVLYDIPGECSSMLDRCFSYMFQ